MKTCTCPKCGKELHVKDDGREFFFCEYCGEKIELRKEEPAIEAAVEEVPAASAKQTYIFFAVTIAFMAVAVLGKMLTDNKTFYLFAAIGIIIGEIGLLRLRTHKSSGSRFSGWQEKIFEDLKENVKDPDKVK